MKLIHFSILPLVIALAFAGCERKIVVVPVPQSPDAPPVRSIPPPGVSPQIPIVPQPVANTKTLETSRLGRAIDSYDREPNSANHAEVKKAVADLDGEIAELELLVAKRSGEEREEAAAKLKNLQSYRAAEMVRFTTAQAKAPFASPAPPDVRTGAEKVEDAAKGIGKSIENAAKKTGEAIKDVVR